MLDQAVYIRLENKERFDELVTLVRKLGERYFIERQIVLTHIVTIKKSFLTHEFSITGAIINRRIEVGEKFIYMLGDKDSLRCTEDIFGMYTLAEMSLLFKSTMPTDRMFIENSEFADIEPFKF